MSDTGSDFQYEAFISYRHKDLDIQVAKAVHHDLETFRLPAAIRRLRGQKRIGKVFRDRDELPLMANLDEGIKQALAGSRWLVVVCTPDLPLSKWCLAEIDYFIQAGRRDKILTILAAGEPEESFPSQLRFVSDEAGGLTELEPLAADLRAPNIRAMRRKLRVEKLRLLAPMLGVGFDDLRRRARERFLRLVVTAALTVALVLAAFGSYAFSQAVIIARQNAELTEQKAKVYANFSREQLERGNRAGAALLALEALPPDEQSPLGAAARNALYAAAYSADSDLRALAQVPGGAEIVPAPDGKTFVASADEYTRLYDAETFRLIYEHPGALTSVAAFQVAGRSGAQVKRAVYNQSGDTVFLPNGSPVFVDVRSGRVLREGYFTDAAELGQFGLSRYQCLTPQASRRHVVDLGDGETILTAPTEHSTAKTLFSPDGRYFAVATYAGLYLYDMAEKTQVATVPDGVSMALQGYIFFSPDSRYLVLTRESGARYPIGEFEESKTIYTIQILEIPSCRIIYENSILGFPWTDGVVPSQALPNYGHVFDSDVPAWLFSPDSSRLLLPLAANEFGLLDLKSGEMLYTKTGLPRFASFSPSGRRLLTIGRSGHTLDLLDAESGAKIAGIYDADTAFLRGFIRPDDETLLIAGAKAGENFCGVYALPPAAEAAAAVYFADESGRYVRPAAADTGAAVVDGRSGETLAELRGGAAFTGAERFAAAGDLVLGLSAEGTESRLSLWAAASGELLVEKFSLPEYRWISGEYFSPPFFLAADESRVLALYQQFGVAGGGFRTYEARTGAVLAEANLSWFSGAFIACDRNLTKLLYIYDNAVSVYDAGSGAKLFTLDDYPPGDLALGTWSGQKAALSADGKWIAVTHSKKNTLEIMDAATGERRQEIPLDGQAAMAPFFAPDGGRVGVASEKTLLAVETATGGEIFSLYEENGFSGEYAFSADGRYLLGADIRDAATGVVISSVSLAARPLWEIEGTAGETIPVGRAHAIYLPALEEALADLRAHIRQYNFTRVEKLRFALE
ncbi:MAG: TIR domain-containing protein [Gracilibacteraceae bacterium]|jgi:WD40 repeat protein|nr:TIR domain-containing protein [Gracilibacteraceae bacterium]